MFAGAGAGRPADGAGAAGGRGGRQAADVAVPVLDRSAAPWLGACHSGHRRPFRRQDRALVVRHGRLGRRQVARCRPQQAVRLVVAGRPGPRPRPRRGGRPWPCRRAAARAARPACRARPPPPGAGRRSGRPTRPGPPRTGQVPPPACSTGRRAARASRPASGGSSMSGGGGGSALTRAAASRHAATASWRSARAPAAAVVSSSIRGAGLLPQPVELGDPRRRAPPTRSRSRSAAVVSARPPCGPAVAARGGLPQRERVGVGGGAQRRQVGGVRVADLRLGVRAEAGGQRRRSGRGPPSPRRAAAPTAAQTDSAAEVTSVTCGERAAHGADGGGEGDRRAGDGRQVPAGERHRGRPAAGRSRP